MYAKIIKLIIGVKPVLFVVRRLLWYRSCSESKIDPYVGSSMARPSPFEQVHLQLGAQMEDYHGWRLPSRFGGAEIENTALRNHCAAFDLSGFGRVSVKGEDAANTLQILGLSPIPDGASQTWTWAGNSQKQSCRIAALRNEYVVLSRPDHLIAASLKNIAEKDNLDVQISDMTEKTAFLGLYGPSAYDSISKVLPFDIDDLEPGGAMPVSFFMMNLILLRGSWLSGDGLELICPVSIAGLVGGSIAKYRQKYNITPAGMECLLSAMNA
jgi:aminomethyltransferase